MFYCASTDSADSWPKAETREQTGLTLCTLASRLQKQKAGSNQYMVIFNFIDYFILVLHDFFPSPVLHDLPHVQIPQVLCLCYAIPTSLILPQLYISTFLRCSFQISLGIVITIAKVSSAYFCVYTEIFTCIRSLSILRHILHCSLI
jgi:hypothetical protein